MITEEIAQHVRQGKTVGQLVALGHKKGTINSLQRKLRQRGVALALDGNGQNRCSQSPKGDFTAFTDSYDAQRSSN